MPFWSRKKNSPKIHVSSWLSLMAIFLGLWKTSIYRSFLETTCIILKFSYFSSLYIFYIYSIFTTGSLLVTSKYSTWRCHAWWINKKVFIFFYSIQVIYSPAVKLIKITLRLIFLWVLFMEFLCVGRRQLLSYWTVHILPQICTASECSLKVIRKFFLKHNKSFRWHLGDDEKHDFFPFEGLWEEKLWFFMVGSLSVKNRFI